MEKVFSRWPTYSQGSGKPECSVTNAALPVWMTAVEPSRSPERWQSFRAATLVLFLPIAFVATAVHEAANASAMALPLIVAAALAILFALIVLVRMHRALVAAEARYAAIFDRAGISMWLEDWTAAADAVAALRERGVTDMEAHFAAKPDELRALCAKVLIKDVSAFTLEEAGVTDKSSVVGPLNQLLPSTDQTFVQWLVAFSRGDRFFRSEAHITRPDGSVSDTLFTAPLPANKSGFSNIIATSLDITEYKSEQARLVAADAEIARAARVSTVGALGASIAHEVNSPLAAVIANAQAALRWLQRPTPEIGEATEAVVAIVAQAGRAKDIISRTRAFFGNNVNPTAPFEIVSAAREANLLVERELRFCGTGVHLRTEPDLPLVKGDVIQVQQVLTNLLLNAGQAMLGQSGAKEITVAFARQGDDVRVDVVDTGPGIELAYLERVFDPLYTTKPDGMGMGLAICRNCIDAQGGTIWASAQTGRGAAFHFTLPVA